MKTVIATFALASVIATSAVVKTEKKSAAFVRRQNSVTCGRFLLADPDPDDVPGFALLHHRVEYD